MTTTRNSKSKATVNAFLRQGLGPPPREDEPERPRTALEAVPPPVELGTAVPAAPAVRRRSEPPPEPEDGEWGELDEFEFPEDAALVRRRARRTPDYQTVRLGMQLSKLMRQLWMAQRRIDPAITYTEFAEVVVRRGLVGLKEDRDRG